MHPRQKGSTTQKDSLLETYFYSFFFFFFIFLAWEQKVYQIWIVWESMRQMCFFKVSVPRLSYVVLLCGWCSARMKATLVPALWGQTRRSKFLERWSRWSFISSLDTLKGSQMFATGMFPQPGSCLLIKQMKHIHSTDTQQKHTHTT